MRFVMLVLLVAVAAPLNTNAAPRLTAVSPPVIQVGTATTLTLSGSGLSDQTRILMPIALASQTLKPGANASRLQLDVTIPPTVLPGFYPLRLADPSGISEAVTLSVSVLPVRSLANEAGPLPVALTGNLAGANYASTTIIGKKGQRLVGEVEAQRLGSSFDPVLAIYTAERRLLSMARPTAQLGGDARCEAVLPADGTYTLELRDLLYRGSGPFCLKIGDLRLADRTVPLAGQIGQAVPVRLVGPGYTNESTTVNLAGAGDTAAVPLPQLAGVAGPAPHVLVSPDPELSEQPAMPSEPQTVPAPGGVTGLLSAPGETDTYRFTTQPGQAYRVEVWGQRLGSPIDPVLTVNAEKGGGLGSADDSPESADPRLDVTVPTGATGLRVTVRDAAGRGGPDFLYRVTVTPKARPDVSLTLENDTFLIPAGGSTSLRVKLQRKGYNGPLDLAWQGLPNGVAGTPSTIPAGVNEAIVSLTTTPEAEPAAQLVRLQATAGGVRQTVVGPGTGPVSLRQDLGCAVVPARPISVAWSGPELTTYTPGSKLTAGANVTRGPTAMGAVRLSLVTSQNVPLAPNKKPDLAKALRLDGEAQIAAGQTSTPLTLAVPADLPKLPYDLVLRAELLSADGKTVQATAETPVRSIQPPAAEKPKAPAKKK